MLLKIGFCTLPAFLLFFLPAAHGADGAEVERGKYLVNEVAKCQDCHTPRGEKGELDTAKWLKGAPLGFAPLQEVKGWHKTAPDLTSSGRLFERWGEKGITNFLMTGVGPSGHAADPPMPAYKLSSEDAKAMVAYLKSLP